jgi:dTDP-4-dehydrorhamnose reductase
MRLSARPLETTNEGADKNPGTLELWSGFECTINRVGDRYFDQTRRNGHHLRQDDMERLADMGVRKVRFPVLWESVAPKDLRSANFEFCDERLRRLKDLGIAPIIGLLHHGSGPPGNTLDAPGFAEHLAEFARLVAERYPWVEYFTPVNEPLTTARFCGLYGHWYPHGRSTECFLKLLMAESRATLHAMRAIREVIPHAKLMQTEDFGRTFSTSRLAYQRDYENERRWLSVDLLCGRVDREHALWDHLVEMGVSTRELDELASAPCPPDIIGIDYYLTSDRFLDHRVERYPKHLIGGNEYEPYVDVEAVRVRSQGIVGHEAVLAEVWERYALPVAFAEVHVGCTREEQLRWFRAAWQAAVRNRERGVDVRAVTLWAAFGSTDWNVLLTQETGHYEPGAYDIRGRIPRPTALVRLAKELSSGREPLHPVLKENGWWQRPERFEYPPYGPLQRSSVTQAAQALVLLGTGPIANAAKRSCVSRNITLRQVGSVGEALNEVESGRAWAVVMDAPSGDPAGDVTHLVGGVTRLAHTCHSRGIPVLAFSSSLVFDGKSTTPYLESNVPEPGCRLGYLLKQIECVLGQHCGTALIVRTGELLDPAYEACPLRRILTSLARSDGVELSAGDLISPAYLPHVMSVSLDLMLDGETGVWHLSNGGVLSWSELVAVAMRNAGPVSFDEPVPSAKPRMRALSSHRGQLLPPLERAIETYLSDYEATLKFELGRRKSFPQSSGAYRSSEM